jgi:hypothetical protein
LINVGFPDRHLDEPTGAEAVLEHIVPKLIVLEGVAP